MPQYSPNSCLLFPHARRVERDRFSLCPIIALFELISNRLPAKQNKNSAFCMLHCTCFFLRGKHPEQHVEYGKKKKKTSRFSDFEPVKKPPASFYFCENKTRLSLPQTRPALPGLAPSSFLSDVIPAPGTSSLKHTGSPAFPRPVTSTWDPGPHSLQVAAPALHSDLSSKVPSRNETASPAPHGCPPTRQSFPSSFWFPFLGAGIVSVSLWPPSPPAPQCHKLENGSPSCAVHAAARHGA